MRRCRLYATKSPTSGQAAVYVDGAWVATVNLYATTTTYRNLVGGLDCLLVM